MEKYFYMTPFENEKNMKQNKAFDVVSVKALNQKSNISGV